jgi:nitrogen fixation NifU-like protein
MSDLSELYQETVMDHNRRPRNFRKLQEATCSLEGYNPLCGDKVILAVKLDDEVIADIGFQGSGCAISQASASMMTERVKGKTREEAQELFEAFHQMITRGPEGDYDPEKLGDLEVLSVVAKYPVRVKCVMLGWHTLQGALRGQHETVATEK